MGRWLVAVVVVVVGLTWSHRADAVVIQTCNSGCGAGRSVAVGNVVVGSTGTNSSLYLTSDTQNYAADLVVSGCSGAAGSFMVQIAGASTNVLLKNTTNNIVDVSYSPAARGTRTCTVNVYQAGTTTPSLASFTISGAGVAPIVSTPPSISFATPVRYADVAAIHTAAMNLVISNASTDAGQTLNVTSVSVDNPDYTITPPGSTQIPPNNGSATWVVTFNPSAVGADNATITVLTNDPMTPAKTVPVSGTGGNAIINVTSTVDFNVVSQGTTSATQNIVVSNTANAATRGPMSVTNATLVNNSAGWFRFPSCSNSTTSCALSMSLTSGSGNVGVACAPPANAAGSQTAQVIITSDADVTTSNTATLNCTAGRADIVVTTTPLDFSPQLVNTTSGQMPVMIQNIGNSTLQYSVALAGTNPGSFVLSGAAGCTTNCPVSAMASVMVYVAFGPTSAGPKSALLRITPLNDPDTTAPIDVPLSGTGTAPIASYNVTSMAFGNVDVAATATPQTLTVTNTGTADLTVSAASFTAGAADYVAPMGTTGTSLSIVVPPSMSATWTIACKPSTQGSRPGTFRVTANNNNTPTNQDISLSCTGQRGNLTITASSYDFGQRLEGSMTTQTFTLTNTGNLPVTTINYSTTGTGTGYSIVSPTFPVASLASNASVTITAQFYPQTGNDGGPFNYMFTGSWGSGTATTSTTLALNGDGQATGYDTSPSNPYPLDWGDIRFDTPTNATMSIINTAGTSYNIQSLLVTPDASTQSSELTIVNCKKGANPAVATTNGCPSGATYYNSSGVNDTITVTLQCKPNNRVGMLGGSILIHTSLPQNPDRTVQLKCNSATGVVDLDPGTVVDFGAVDLDLASTATTKTITITNTGTAAMNIGTVTKTTAGPFVFSATPSATVAASGGTYSFDVTYTPTVERAPNQPETANVVLPLAGAIGTPGSISIQISGYGADRHLDVAPAPTFPPTFRNPGDAAPVRPVTLTNNGDFPLTVSAVMLTSDPVWTLVNPDPVVVPARGTYDFNVKFAPVTAGKAPTGHMVIENDDNTRPTVSFDFDGMGLDRNVSVTPLVIDFGYAPIGGTVKLSDVSPTTPLEVASMEAVAQIMIHQIQVDGEGFSVIDETGGAPSDVPLDPGTVKKFDVIFTPDRDGTFEGTATLYLDQDPSAQSVIMLRGHAATVDIHGGGGCAAGHDVGGATLILVALVFVLRRRRGASIAGVLVFVAGTTARADDIDSETFRPTPAIGSYAFQLEPAGVGKEGEWAASAMMTFASNSVAVQAMDSGMVVSDEHPVTRRAGLELGGAYAFFDRFEAGVRVPLYSQQGESDSTTTFHIPAAKGASLGDVGIHGRAQLLQRSALVVGAGLHLTLPTSSQDQFVGLDSPSARLLALVAYKLPTVTFGGNVGPILRKTAEYRNEGGIIHFTQGSGVAWSVGGSFRANERLSVSGELFGEVNRGGFGGTGYTSPVDGLVGLHYGAGSVTVGLAVGRGLSRALGTPDIRGVLVVAFSPLKGDRAGKAQPPPTERDTDADGIVDALDRCPADKEDHLGNVTDGCPLVDADHDGIADADDKCPLEGEDKDAFQDEDGCPDPDDDGDTIADTQDKCPDAAEVINGVDDNDGCPDQAATTTVSVGEGKTPQQAAEEAFKQGRDLIKEKKFAQACSAFEVSQRLDPQFGTQYNLAGCYVQLGKLATGWNLYRELSRTDSNPDRRAASGDNAKRLAPRVPKVILKLKNPVPGVSIFMNNVDSTALIGLEIPVDLTRYDVVAGATGYKPWRESFEVKDEGKTTTITIDLQPTQ